MRIAAEALAVAYAHAREAYPEEACGLLVGDKGGDGVDEARRCENMQNALHAEDPVANPRDARMAYSLGARDLFFLDKSQRSERPVRVVYHSHVEVGAYFSAKDKDDALLFGEPRFPVDYLVVDVKKAEGVVRVAGAKLFRFDGAEFVEVAAYPGEA